MGLFKKKEKSEEIKLPELPRLPKLPEIKDKKPEKFIHQLPRFPNDSLGEKFLQNTIKETVTGKKEDEGVFADEFASEDELQMMHEPRIKEIPEEFPYQKKVARITPEPESFKGFKRVVEEKKPLFVRIDKFEEGLRALQNASRLISEIEKLLQDIKRIKEEEGKELESWEKQIQAAKMEIEKIDRDVFSKIE